MKYFQLLLLGICLPVLFACKKEKEDPAGSGEGESVHFSMAFDSVKISVVKDLVGEYSNTTIAYGELEVSRNAGESWTNYYGQIESVSKAGRAIYKNGPQERYLMHPGGGISKFTDQRFDTYYIDSEDNLYHVKLSGGQYYLETGTTGFDWKPVNNHPENLGIVILGPYPGEGMAFLNEAKRKVFVYSPSTETWDSVQYESSLNPQSDHYSIENDGKVYMPSVFSGLCDIVDLTDGSVIQITLPDQSLWSGDPNFEATKNGDIYFEGYNPNEDKESQIYHWNGAAWETYELAENYDFRGELKIYDNTMYYYAFCYKGPISRGLAMVDIATGETKITGNTNPETLYSGFVTSDGITYAVEYADRQLYRHDGDFRTPTGIYDVFGFYEDPDGKLFMMSDEDVLYVSNTDLSDMKEVEGVLANHGGDLTYGNADGMIMRKLANGSYILWLVTNYTSVFINYSLDNVFVSDDGLNWEKFEIEKYPGSYDGTCKAIDPDGTIIYVERQRNIDLNVNQSVYWQSADNGASWSAYTQEYPPDFISSSGNYIYSTLNEIRTSKNGWAKMEITQDHFTPVGAGTGLTGDDRLIIEADQLWVSDKKF